MRTVLLDTVAWDLVVDARNNIAVAEEPYALAQDAASAIRLFLDELWYDTVKGIPYDTTILGQEVPLALLKQQFSAAALTVPGIVNAQVFIRSIDGRDVQGQVQVTDANGVISVAGF